MFEGIFEKVFAGLIGSVVAGLGGFFAWGRLKDRLQSHVTPRLPGTRISILVAKLDGDAEGVQTAHVIASLEDQFSHGGSGPAMHISGFPDVLRLKQGEVSAAVAKAEEKGRKWLARKGADLLVWGEASAQDKVVRLRFLVREDEESGGGDAKRYKLGEVLELPEGFSADVGAAIAVSAAVAIQPVYDRPGQALADIIEPAVNKLAPLAARLPASFSSDAKASIWHSYAAGEYQLGEERGDNARLETAIANYRKALTEWTRERAPLDWARAQNSIGRALSVLGEREASTERLEVAVAAYREALKEYTRERVPLDWAATQNNLGAALQTLGERESGTARLEVAVAALRDSLKEYTRERVPLQWATTQNNLGTALCALGERESGTARLEETVAAYRDALKERTRERVPLDWAMTQNNLGVALRALGERESGTARLEEAVTAYSEALKEYTRDHVPLIWAETQLNLAGALGSLGERESGVARLEEAASAYREALKECRRERVPLDWGKAMWGLGLVLTHLGERENGTARLEQAVATFREAVKECTRERVPLDWAMTQNNLGLALEALGQRLAVQNPAQGVATLKEARAAYLDALGEFIRSSASHYEDIARRNIGRVGQIIASLGNGG